MIKKLTPRQRDILMEVLQGKSNQEVADCFGITQATAERHVFNIYKRLGVHNRSGLFHLAKDAGLMKLTFKRERTDQWQPEADQDIHAFF